MRRLVPEPDRSGVLAVVPVMNDTKWNELRLAKHGLAERRPAWRTTDISGYICPWNGEWFYHFLDGGYESIEWLEIRVDSPEQDSVVLAALQEIHVPGQRIEQGFRVYGHVADGASVNYL